MHNPFKKLRAKVGLRKRRENGLRALLDGMEVWQRRAEWRCDFARSNPEEVSPEEKAYIESSYRIMRYWVTEAKKAWDGELTWDKI